MTDIVERLRGREWDGEALFAADTITALRAEVERLTKALDAADYLIDRYQTCLDIEEAFEAYSRARSALKGEKG